MEENKQIIGSIRDEALYYISIGIPIIPLCSSTHKSMSPNHIAKCKSPGKTPLISKWNSWSGTSKEDILNWFRDAKKTQANINLGVPLGKNSGMVGLDIDGRSGEIILLAIAEGQLPKTWEFITGSGRRILYKIPGNMTTKKVKIAGKEKHEGFEILCDGQQTVWPPSVHANGTTYKWKTGCSPRDIPLADCPRWILDKIDASKNTDTLPRSKKITEADWNRVLHEGERNDGITKLIGSELAKGRTREQTLLAALTYNKNFCDPPLVEKEISITVEGLALKEEMNRSKQVREGTDKPKKPQLRPTSFMKNFLTIQRELGYVWKYSAEMGLFFKCDENDGPWKMIDMDYVKSIIRKQLINFKQGGSITWDSQKNAYECIEALKAELVEPDEFDIFDLGFSIQNNTWKHNPLDIVCLQNGVYDWRNNKLLPWSSEIYTTLKLPVTYDPNAKCPYWTKALNDWIPSKETQHFLQEFVGLCLVPDTSFRTAVFLYGTGSNGKSMFLDVIRLLFGKGLVSIPLHRLTDRFTTAYLQNKLINICGDIDAKYITDTGVVKGIITGDTLHAEYKHGKDFDFVPVARLMFSANSLPPVADKTHGWYSRWKYVKFPKTFEVNPTYKIEYDRLFGQELSGILNWALEGLIRLKQHNKWTGSEDMKMSEIEYRSENDNVAAFLDDYAEQTEYSGNVKDAIQTQILHRCYKNWIENYLSGTKTVSLKEFSRRVRTYGYDKTNRIIDGKSRNVFIGMRPKSEFMKDYQQFKMMA